MARPRTEHPTPAELEILKILWETGPATVRDVLEVLEQQGRGKAYTSVMSLMNVMTDKGLLTHTPQGRAHLYRPRVHRKTALAGMIGDLWQRAYEGSASTLVAHLLEEANPSAEELKAIRRVINSYRRQQEEEED